MDSKQSRRNKRLGWEAEDAVVDWLISWGFPAERRSKHGKGDKGDIIGVPYTCIEVKNWSKMDLAGWLKQLKIEMQNSDSLSGAIIVKKRGKGNPKDWYVVMDGEQWIQLLSAFIVTHDDTIKICSLEEDS